MDPVTMVIIPGFIGGLVIALLIARVHRKPSDLDPFASERPSTDIINMARIRVAGIGGLGLVAMALVVAFNIPRIRQSVMLGVVLGALFGVILILWRKHAGVMPSSGRRAGANTTLSIEVPSGPDDKEQTSSDVQRRDAVAVRPVGSP